jgi:hypothetical protein
MPLAAAGIGAAGSLIGGLISGNAAENAAQTQAAAARQAQQLQAQEFGQQQQNMQPWMSAGTGALNQLAAGTQAGGQFMQAYPGGSFSFDPSQITQDQGYQFQLQQGQQALQRAQASTGINGGGAAKAIARYSQGLASTEYGNAFNRALQTYDTNYNAWSQNQANQFNRLSSLSGQGQSAAGSINQDAANYANQAGGYITQGANALAAGQVAQANALAGGISGAGQAAMQYGLYKQMNQSGYGGGGGWGNQLSNNYLQTPGGQLGSVSPDQWAAYDASAIGGGGED